MTNYLPSHEYLMERFNELPVTIIPIDRELAKEVKLENLKLAQRSYDACEDKASEKAIFLRKSIQSIKHELKTIYKVNF